MLNTEIQKPLLVFLLEHLCEYFLNVKILCDFSEKFLLEGIT